MKTAQDFISFIARLTADAVKMVESIREEERCIALYAHDSRVVCHGLRDGGRYFCYNATINGVPVFDLLSEEVKKMATDRLSRTFLER